MKRANEKSTVWLTITFKDKNGENETPTSAEYRIDTKGGTQLKDWTDISNPTAEYELTITPDDNVIEDSGNDLETDSLGNWQTNIVTIRAVFGANDEQNDEYKYQIRDLTQIPKA